MQLSSAITETSVALTSIGAWHDRHIHWRTRTFALAEQTFALLRQPGKVASWQIFDYNTTLGTAVGGAGEFRIAGSCSPTGGTP